MVTVYANQAAVRAEDLPGVIRAAEVLGFGVKIENVLVPEENGSYALAWMVTRDEDTPTYDDWDGRYEESEDVTGLSEEIPGLSVVE